MSTDTIRLTVRALAGDFRREIDLQLADSVTFNEIAPEVWQLLQAPPQTLPWRLSTVAGRPIDTAAQLRDAGLDDGAVVIARPGVQAPLPELRDGAEALSALPTLPVQAASSLWCAAACLAGLLVVGPQHALWVGLALLMLVLYARSRTWVGVFAGLLCGAGAWQYVGGFVLPQLSRTGLAAGGAALALAVVVAAAFTGPAQRYRHRLVAWAVAFGLCAAGCQLHPAAGLGLAVLALSAAPGLSTRAADVRIPRLPTAGEDLDVADGVQDCSGLSALQARMVYSGILLGAVCGAVVSICAADSSWWLVLLCLAIAGAALLHALRHSHNVAAWTLHAFAALSVLGAAWHAHALLADAPLLGHGTWRTLAVVLALLCLALATASPWWARHAQAMEPTSIVWVERAEMLLLAAALPLCLQCAGVFAFIRGLG